MSVPVRVGIVGATGAVGRLLIQLLEERRFPVSTLHLIASHRSLGQALVFNHQSIAVEDVATFDFSQCDLCFFSAGKAVSEQYAPIAVKAGCCVVDNTSAFRYQDDVPLVIPEVNGDVLDQHDKPGIIANPNCSTIQMLVALDAIYKAVGIRRIIVSTYQAVSGAGQKAINRLVAEQKATAQPKPDQLANNVLPQIDSMQPNGYTREEMKMHLETQKIWGDGNILVDATAVRVPVINGHSEAITIETAESITPERAKQLISAAEGASYVNEPAVTPLSVSGSDTVFVSRIRQSLAYGDCGLTLWVVGDNLRKGAATNSLQIAEKWLISKI